MDSSGKFMSDSNGFTERSPIVNYVMIVIAGILVFVFFTITINRLDASASQLNYRSMSDGVSNALRAYSKCYSMTNENLAKIAEGYLNQNDLDVAKFGINSNGIAVDLDKANSYFYRILHGNTGISEERLRGYKFYIVYVYTVYDYNKVTGVYKENYVTEIRDSRNDRHGSKVCRNTDEVASFVGDVTKVGATDIGASLSNSIHKEQKYSRDTQYNNGVHVVSSYSTYMCLGYKIPIEGWVKHYTTTIRDIQTYSNNR